MRIKEAKWEDGWLMLKTADVDARHFAYKFKGEGEYELKPKKELRSLDANAYMWVLCEKIAKAVGITKTEVYRDAIKAVGEYTPLPIKEPAVDEFKRLWAGRGLGWFVEVVDDSKLPGYKLCFAYYGSSVYSRRQLSRVIDNLIQDAKAVGVETMPPEQLESLMRQWEERYESKKQ